MTMMMIVQLRRSQRLKSLKLVDRVLCDLQHMLHSTRMRSVSAWAKAILSGKTANQISVGMTTHPCAKLKVPCGLPTSTIQSFCRKVSNG